jgi:hypothetical protein
MRFEVYCDEIHRGVLTSAMRRIHRVWGIKWSKVLSAGAEIKRPLISYAGSAAETSIGSKPMGNELTFILSRENTMSRVLLRSEMLVL